MLLLALLLGAVVAVPAGERLGVPPPVLMTLGGIVLALLPFVPNVEVPPELILPVVLPPLLYAAVQRTSWRQFAANWQPIVLLAVALVFVTAAAVAAVVDALVPGLPLAAAVALGALVAPPDPVAATAIAGRLGLPRRLVSILEGEGLFNDVTAIVLYNVAIAAAVTGTFSVPGALGRLALSAGVAVAAGLAVGWAGGRLADRIGGSEAQIGLSLILPFVGYAVAEQLHGSGVLAVLTTALYLTSTGNDADDVLGRLAGGSFWQVVDMLVTGVAFGLIGLELHHLFGQEDGRPAAELLRWSAAVTGVVVAVRLLWLLPAAWLAQKARPAVDDADLPATWRETIVMWWSGMRGVASVALALAIPRETDGGAAFPERSVLVFIAFVVVFVTLLVQGLTLPWLVRRLGVKGDTAAERSLERDLARRAAEAGLRRLRELQEAEDLPDEPVDALERRVRYLGTRLSPDLADDERRQAFAHRAEQVRRLRRVEREVMSAARRAVLSARNEPGTDPEVVDRLLYQLDVRSLH